MAAFCHRSILLLFLLIGLTLADYQAQNRILNEVKSSLTFIIDTTTSMTDDLAAVKAGANAIFDSIMNSNSSEIEDYVLVTFDDPSPPVIKVKNNRFGFKRDLDAVQILKDPRNKDCPELSMGGIYAALENSRRKSFLFVFTDAGAKDFDLYSDVSSLAKEKGCKIIFVLTGKCGKKTDPDYAVYEKLANDTNGEIFDLHKGEIPKILDYIKESMDSRREELGKETLPPGKNTIFVPVREDILNVLISVSGERPFLEVLDPNEEKQPFEVVVDLSNVFIVKINDPKPGVYTIITDSKCKVTVTVTGKIKDKPAELARETTLTVREGTSVKMGGELWRGHPTPVLTWEFRPAGAGDFTLLPVRGEEYSIKMVTPAHAGMYRFAAENSLGRDEEYIELIVEELPRIAEDDGIYTGIVGDLDARLPCVAMGNPTPTISWWVDGQMIAPGLKYGLTDDGTLIIHRPVKHDTNSYTCEAENGHGKADNTVDLFISNNLSENDFGDVTVVYMKRGDSTYLPCPRAHTDTFRWFINGTYYDDSSDSISILNAGEDFDGYYTCRVSNMNGTESHTFFVDVGYAPLPRQRGVRNIEWTSGDEVIDCNIDMKPSAENYKWLHKGEELNGKNYMNLRIVDWGDYTCEAKNVHGTAETHFHVVSKDCMIKENKPYGPRVIGFGSTLTHDPTGEYVIVRSGASVRLACSNQSGQQNSFVNFRGKSVINAVCNKEDKYLVYNKAMTLDDLQCRH